MAGTIRHFPMMDPDERLTLRPQPLPDLLVEDAGSIYGKRPLDVTRICHVHQFASLKVPVLAGIDPPVCDECEAHRRAVDGRARYQDLKARREAGLI